MSKTRASERARFALERLRSGDFLDLQRIVRLAAAALAASVLGIGALVLLSDGGRDSAGRPLGTDFMSFWIAGDIARMQGPAAAFDLDIQYEAHEARLGENPPFFPFFYPPTFLFAALAFSAAPYLGAWIAWMGASLAGFGAIISRIVPGRAALLAGLGAPGIFVTVIHGQNGVMLAAIFAGALALLPARPLAAGALIGLLAVKPQFGVLIPLALIAAGERRAFAAAAASTLLLLALTTVAFGVDVWPAFFEIAHYARSSILESGAGGFEKMQSLFAACRQWGAPTPVAYCAQGVLGIAAAAGVTLLWRARTTAARKAAGLMLASLAATPYLMDYDLVIAAPAIAFLVASGVRSGFAPYEKTLLAALWAAPFFARPVMDATGLPIGLIAAAALFVVNFRAAGLADLRRPIEARA